MPSFSLVTTVFNEMRRLDETISDIEAQILKPDEIVITDAGSKDGTFERLLKWKEESDIDIVVLQKIKCNVAEGRNLAIKQAKHNLIASTDFGCRYKNVWLKELIEPFSDSHVKVVGGAFSVVEKEINTAAGKADYILSQGYRVNLDEHFLPSSRSIAYYKEVWQKIGGYPEWLTLAGDDSTFAYLIKKLGYTIHFAPNPNVFWGRHKTFDAFARESYRYALGAGESRAGLRNFFSKLIEIGIRYSIPFHILLYVLGLIPAQVSLVIGIFQLVGFRSYWTAFKYWKKVKSEKYHFGIFILSLYLVDITRLSHIKGYLKGYWFSSSNKKTEAKKLQLVLSK